ncbi:glycoside hydrolase family protein [Actinomadura montaniterrae]|uniref:Uncharacterized protein n=1 Tax=Actinomadura montaniterrae TaxID=1803903 RepID=A0A6L3W587_9ACTN|nr:hypothetical protein [Actinomadura montaniterrae]KAB2388814.1 hypothetical protein F9B16_02530 [Actinomadura montaniterrae]
MLRRGRTAPASMGGLAREVGDTCVARTWPNSLGQYCGAAGVGDYLLNITIAKRSERYQDAASDLGHCLLLLSSGPQAHPGFFTATDTPDRSLSWSMGLCGVLSSFRLAHCSPGCLPDLPAMSAGRSVPHPSHTP